MIKGPTAVASADCCLGQILGAWLHQDWGLEFHDWHSAIRAAAHAQPSSQVQGAVSELDALLATDASEPDLMKVVERFGCDFDPNGVGLSYRAWLTKVREDLAAP
jgi:hypothetical protein